jgi:hypothetical protein
MKQCQKWWTEEQTKETEEELLAKLGGLTTQEQLIDVLVETVWRAAFELMLEWLEIEEPFETFQARIKEELTDE